MESNQDKKRMTRVRKLVGFFISLILIFIVIALVRFQLRKDMSLPPDQMEFFFNEGWLMASIDSKEAADTEQKDADKMLQMIRHALKEPDCQKVGLPFKQKASQGDILVFKNVLPQGFAGLTISFFSTDADVRVHLGGEEIYQVRQGSSGKPNGRNENFIDIPQTFEDGELWIEMTASVPNATIEFSNVKLETRNVSVIGVVETSVTDIGCCLLIIIVAIVMFVLAVIRLYSHQPARGEMFLGLAGLVSGVYCFIGIDTFGAFYTLQEVYDLQRYLALLLPLFLTLYFKWNFRTLYPHRFIALLCVVGANVVVQIFLQLFGICDLEKMSFITVAMEGLVCVTAMTGLIQLECRNRSSQLLMSLVSMIILLSGIIANVIMNWMSNGKLGDAVMRYSIAAFCAVMVIMHTLQISKEYWASIEERAKVAEQQNIQLAQAKKDADAARQEALAANEAKRKFLAHMSHEIRTPINAVLGMDEMILRESKEQNVKEYAMDIYMAGQTLLSLINDILDFSKIESGKMEIVPVEYDTSSMIYDLANMTSQRAQNKNISFKVEIDQNIPSKLYGDDVRIRQILTNILTNAVKYTPEGTVWLRIQSHLADNNAVLRFEVEDTGIGIKKEDLPKLSAEFERIEEERNRNIEGSGLGMNITIQLLSLFGSRLYVESEYGKGSKFYFELEQKIVDYTPIGDFKYKVRQLAKEYNYSAKFCAPDAKILVVDDNAVNRKVLRNLLKETLIEVTDAGGGRECLALVQQNHYDLIFLDHMMPEMDGVETLHQIKALSGCLCKDTPVVVLTANAVSGAKEKYLAEGFDDFLSKPVVPQKLELMIRKMLPESLIREGSVLEQETGYPQQEEVMQGFLEELPQVDGLDWQYAWMHLPDMELLEYTVKEFYAQIDSAAERLEQAYMGLMESTQLEQFRIQAHAMKSLAATVGILPLSGVARILEYAAKDSKIETIKSITPAFLEEWRSYREKLQGVFGIEAQGKKEVTDPSVIQALLEMVRLSMQEMDIDQADRMMSQLREYTYPDKMEQNIRSLVTAVTDLNMEETQRLTDLLIGQMSID